MVSSFYHFWWTVAQVHIWKWQKSTSWCYKVWLNLVTQFTDGRHIHCMFINNQPRFSSCIPQQDVVLLCHLHIFNWTLITFNILCITYHIPQFFFHPLNRINVQNVFVIQNKSFVVKSSDCTDCQCWLASHFLSSHDGPSRRANMSHIGVNITHYECEVWRN